MTPLAEQLRDEIARGGPVSFRRFMEVALYDPAHGYYRRTRDPFGKQGDFFTAEQLQPVFGILIARVVDGLWREMGEPAGFTVAELGAGRGEMRDAFARWRYLPIDAGQGALPPTLDGLVFANEFFDALPVDRVVWRDGVARLARVAWADGRFAFLDAEEVSGDLAAYLDRYVPPHPDRDSLEVCLDALGWIERIAASLRRGWLLAIDYGYTRLESARFPLGSLMGYCRHMALDDVLADPGERDMTAHVAFSALEEHGASLGLARVRFEGLAQLLLRAGESDQFAEVMALGERGKLQLKTLLFGMGETFRALLLRK